MPGLRHPLPYGFARSQQLLLEEDDAGRLTLWMPVGAPASAVGEVLRKYPAAQVDLLPADQLAQRLAQIEVRTPTIPVLHNLDAAARSEPSAIRAALTEQLYRPVRWSRIVQSIEAAGVKLLFECGPGKVLTNMNKRIAPEAQACALEKPEGQLEAAALLAPQAVQA